MWDRRYVSDTCDNQACALQRPYSSLTARSRSPDQHVYLSQSLVHPSASGLLRSALSGKGCSLTGAFETNGTAAGRRNHAALRVGDTNQGVLGLGISFHHLLLTTGSAATASDSAAGPLPGASIGSSSLSVGRQTAPVPKTTVGADLYQSADILVHFPPKVTL